MYKKISSVHGLRVLTVKCIYLIISAGELVLSWKNSWELPKNLTNSCHELASCKIWHHLGMPCEKTCGLINQYLPRLSMLVWQATLYCLKRNSGLCSELRNKIWKLCYLPCFTKWFCPYHVHKPDQKALNNQHKEFVFPGKYVAS